MNILRATAITARASDKVNQEGGNRAMINDFKERLATLSGYWRTNQNIKAYAQNYFLS
jgi:hypothetical protein